jgi:RNA polymerase sigma-70 factor (ECF subfamily)
MTADASRLSRIDTPWSILRRAHDGSDPSIAWARQALLDRYGGAVRRYLRAVLRDEEAADEVFQEFALRLVRGDFHTADPARGKFRNFVKAALHNLIVDYRRKIGRDRGRSLDERSPAAAEQAEPPESLFMQSWGQDLLDRSWVRLSEIEQEGGTPYYAALRLLADSPELSSDQIAQRLTTKLGREFTPGNVRVMIHRARQMFADQLVAEVADSLESAAAEEIEQELGDLNLLQYCKSALARHFE